MPPPADRLAWHLVLALVAVFGLGYFWVGLDPARNHAVVGLGALGKTAVFLILLGHAVAGTIPYAPVGFGAVDVLFAAAFAGFLWRAHAGASRAATRLRQCPDHEAPRLGH
jgi:hypothetical protein